MGFCGEGPGVDRECRRGSRELGDVGVTCARLARNFRAICSARGLRSIRSVRGICRSGRRSGRDAPRSWRSICSSGRRSGSRSRSSSVSHHRHRQRRHRRRRQVASVSQQQAPVASRPQSPAAATGQPTWRPGRRAGARARPLKHWAEHARRSRGSWPGVLEVAPRLIMPPVSGARWR